MVGLIEAPDLSFATLVSRVIEAVRVDLVTVGEELEATDGGEVEGDPRHAIGPVDSKYFGSGRSPFTSSRANGR